MTNIPHIAATVRPDGLREVRYDKEDGHVFILRTDDAREGAFATLCWRIDDRIDFDAVDARRIRRALNVRKPPPGPQPYPPLA